MYIQVIIRFQDDENLRHSFKIIVQKFCKMQSISILLKHKNNPIVFSRKYLSYTLITGVLKSHFRSP